MGKFWLKFPKVKLSVQKFTVVCGSQNTLPQFEFLLIFNCTTPVRAPQTGVKITTNCKIRHP